MNERFEDLLGKTLSSVEKNDDNDEIIFRTTDGDVFRLFHCQDCCESVYVEDIIGDLADLIGRPLTMAEEVIHEQDENPDGVTPPEEFQESFTWTFYKLATARGYVTIRWYGSSNGYYSESVSFAKDEPKNAN